MQYMFCPSIDTPAPPSPSTMPISTQDSRVSNRVSAWVVNGTIDFDLSAPQCPATLARQQALHADAFIDQPSIARANIAASTQRPNGSMEYSYIHRHHTVLQQHVLYWDRDADGKITPLETYLGFRDLGFGVFFSLLSMLIINLSFSYPTRLAYSLVPDPWCRIYVNGIHKAKHGSDSGVFDNEGRFVPQAFEDLFSKWDLDRDGALSATEFLDMVAGHRVAGDPFGWFAAIFEFGSTWLLLQEHGSVSKEDLRRVYDVGGCVAQGLGSIFWKIREQRQKGRRSNKGFGVGKFRKFLHDFAARAKLGLESVGGGN
ncbi:Caleosin related protein-domain-containing protein [Cercophora scortea]|uniref:Caleosin related protein-domain-containing protein n=1 Tax=Cercophora scortea TaxID=314031 RepID=A0AAE0I6X0_9PEZI|nr:Caleosin related protein-domain-containing protein [Cercophora scortea]